ncbi:MAG: protein translocase subunit SecF [Candidatus Paceibacterota bacterium]|jgi:preprotein translocase subunit SecF
MIKYRKIFFIFSGILSIISIVSLSMWGLKFGIDFTGGSLLEVKFSNTTEVSVQEIKDALEGQKLLSLIIQPVGDDSFMLRFQQSDEATHQKVLTDLRTLATSKKQTLEEKRYDSIGPVVGRELKSKTLWAVFLSAVGIISYIAWAFRRVSWPVASWKYGTTAVIALIHDLLIVTGIFSILGRFSNIEVGLPFVAALMTIFGYSVHDTIVVFDRIRENLGHSAKETFEEIVNRSISQTLIRSINTSLLTELALVAIMFFGGETIKDFVLALIFGIFFGTYSSIFIASALLVTWENWKHRTHKA